MGADAGGGKGGISAGGGDGVGECNVVVVGDDVIDETGGVVIDGDNTAAIGDVVVGLTDGVVCGEDGIGGNRISVDVSDVVMVGDAGTIVAGGNVDIGMGDGGADTVGELLSVDVGVVLAGGDVDVGAADGVDSVDDLLGVDNDARSGEDRGVGG